MTTLAGGGGSWLTTTAAAPVRLVPVMKSGAEAVGCSKKAGGSCTYVAFRIPGLVNAGNNTLIAFAEGRKYGCGDFGPFPDGGGLGFPGNRTHIPPAELGKGQHDMVLRRSTNGGESWGKLTTIVDAVDFPPWKGLRAESKVYWPKANLTFGDAGNAVWDPTPVWDRETDTVWLFFNGPGREDADCAAGLCATWATQSRDKGLTWTVATNMTAQCQRPFAFNHNDPLSARADSASNGGGIQLRDGRLVIGITGGPAATTCFSDNHGETWQAAPFKNNTGARGERIRYNTGDTKAEDEVEIAELTDGTLYMTIRNDDLHSTGYACSNTSAGHHNLTYNCDGHRQFATSTDRGLSWTDRLNVDVPDPGCKGGVVAAPALAPAHSNALVLSTSASCMHRDNQTIFISLDGGKLGSWAYRQKIHALSGYSTLQMTDGGLIADLFEEGGCQLTLALVDPKDIIADGPKGAIHCADVSCPASPFPAQPQFDGTRGYCK
jgi:sialidase-1